ncbi:MAG: M10 family metallopeptidase C-terminal domain-containing protein, partial [Pseudomonadota bacterium]|nr:M10 family metallopeptidase C-terminal domain-containing protein [Pseudomonadota bacterium]
MAAGAEPVTNTGDQDVDGLLSGSKWKALALSYSFFASEGDLGGHQVEEFQPLAERERVMTKSILDQVSSFTNLTFAAAESAAGGDLRFGSAKMGGAYAYYPAEGIGGDAWFSKEAIGWGSAAPGDNLHFTFIHEIGHALGLKHGHEHPRMTPEHLGHEFSVMPYTSWVGQDPDFIVGWGNENGGFPQTFMMYDIAALQHMYGANFTHNASDTTYSWDPATGRMFVNGAGQATPHINRVFMTLWDGGGTDTYDLSNYADGVTIDLRPGQWTKTSLAQTVDLNYQGWDVPPTYARGNIANALLFNGDTRSLIENAIGGAGKDVIIGNEAANRLSGGLGADVLAGSSGDDFLEGGGGDDVLNGGTGFDIAEYGAAAAAVKVTLALTSEQDTGGAGKDTLQSLEGVAGSAYGDQLTGNTAANVLMGRGGNDILSGGDGDDVLEGGTGDDRLVGGQGSDTASYSGATGAVTLNLAETSAQNTGGGGVDRLSSIENARGSRFADTLTGNAGANLLDGAGGADTMTGGAGDDTYVVDNGSDRVIEAAGGGNDTVRSSLTRTLSDTLENLVLIGERAIDGTGNALANRLTGNSAANVLRGGAG